MSQGGASAMGAKQRSPGVRRIGWRKAGPLG